nr:MAG TPA: CCSMST1 family protein [Caudoviricetes sp.]
MIKYYITTFEVYKLRSLRTYSKPSVTTSIMFSSVRNTDKSFHSSCFHMSSDYIFYLIFCMYVLFVFYFCVLKKEQK